ncbi:hypothetical protein A2U01_0005271, partial [Trifolium medium]|nr:hypothetical protein [Trifolium medium]
MSNFKYLLDCVATEAGSETLLPEKAQTHIQS